MQDQNQSSPNPQYDFIFKGEQQSAKKSRLPTSGLPKWAVIVGGGALFLIVVIIVYSIIFGGKATNADQITGIIGRATEIARLSQSVIQDAQDPATQNLAATTQAALTSDSARLTTYLQSNKVKVDSAKLKLYTNNNTDNQIQTALQSNSLPGYYASYLKSNLTVYASAISALYNSASPKSKPILFDAFNNAKVILTSSPVNNAPSS